MQSGKTLKIANFYGGVWFWPQRGWGVIFGQGRGVKTRVPAMGTPLLPPPVPTCVPADIRSQEKPHQSVTVDEKRVGQFKAKIKKWIWDGGVPFKWHIAAHVPYKCNVIYKNVMIYICQKNICQNWINVEVWCWVPATCWLFFKYLIAILTNKEKNDCRYLEKKCLGT